MILLNIVMVEGPQGIETRITYADGGVDSVMDQDLSSALVRLGSLADGEAKGEESSYLNGQVNFHTAKARR